MARNDAFAQRNWLADPSRAHYAPLVERGENWSDENIDYFEHPDRTTTCAHLQPIEHAMRSAGIETRRYREVDITAKCRIDFPALQRAFRIAAPVRYAEFYGGDRASTELPTAYLYCDEDKSMLSVLHPEAGGARDARVPYVTRLILSYPKCFEV